MQSATGKQFCQTCQKEEKFLFLNLGGLKCIVLLELVFALLYVTYRLGQFTIMAPVLPYTLTGVPINFTGNGADFTYRLAFSDFPHLLDVIFIVFYSIRILELIYKGIHKILSHGRTQYKRCQRSDSDQTGV